MKHHLTNFNLSIGFAIDPSVDANTKGDAIVGELFGLCV